MRWPWHRRTPIKAIETGPIGVEMTRTSTEWGQELERLRSDLSATETQIDTTTAELGAALLESQEARATDLESQTVGLEARRRGLVSAIETAEQNRQAALRDEQRQRDSIRLRAAATGAVAWLEYSARVAEAQAALAAAQIERERRVDRVQLEHDLLWAAGRGMSHPDDGVGIEYFRTHAARGALNARGQVVLGDELLDPATIPAKPRAVPTAEEEAAAAAGVRRSSLRQVGSLLTQYRRNIEACRANNDQRGVATWREKITQLEARQVELETAPVAVLT